MLRGGKAGKASVRGRGGGVRAKAGCGLWAQCLNPLVLLRSRSCGEKQIIGAGVKVRKRD